MKNLLIALVVLSSLVACGKKNTVGGTTGVVGLTNPITAPTAVETDFLTRVNGNQFGINMYVGFGSYYGQSMANAISHGANPIYIYANYAAPTVIAPNCHNAWIFRVCNTSTSSGSYQQVTESRRITNSDVNLTNKQNEIIGIFNRKSRVESNGIGGYRILTTDNKTYYFDITLPIQANPTQTYNADGSGEFIMNVL